MKIEKISESQVKFVLSKTDLSDRDIRITELAYGSEKTQELFREMLEQAFYECNFVTENIPLMIEAIPVSQESIVIIVTKVSNQKQIEDKFNLLPRSQDAHRFKFKSKGAIEPEAKTEKDNSISIFSFENLDQVTSLSLRLYTKFTGTNTLFKNEKRYYLFLKNDEPDDDISTESLDAILSEYGQKHVSTLTAKHYLDEHGEIIIADSAIKILAEY